MGPLLAEQTSWSTMVDRQRSLAITSPLQYLEGGKGHIGVQNHDIPTYGSRVIDQIALGMRAERGERSTSWNDLLSELITEMRTPFWRIFGSSPPVFAGSVRGAAL